MEENSHDLWYACYDAGVHGGGHRIIEVSQLHVCPFAFSTTQKTATETPFDQLEVVNTVGICRDRRLLQVHAGMHCDACGQSPILGEWFRCTECHDYDLCNDCYRTMDHPHDMYKCSEWTWMYSELAA